MDYTGERMASRLRAIVRWLAPSVVAACVASVVVGVIEGWGSSVVVLAATTGFLALAGVPLVTVLSCAIRALWRWWQPAVVLGPLTEAGGGTPLLAAWLVYLLLATGAFAALVFRATWQLGARTRFVALDVSFVEPLIWVGSALLLFVLSRPCVRAIAIVTRRIDRRWALRPRRIAATMIAIVLALAIAAWFVLGAELGPIDGRPLVVVAIGVVAVLASHALSRRAWPIWRWCSRVMVVVAVAAIATAGFALRARPGLTLAIWGDRPVAGLVIDHVFNLDAIRDQISLASFRPAPRPQAPHPDIILITIDTVRADHTPPYGGTADMPFLEHLAKRGTVFDWAFSPSNVTRRSIPSMVIGVQPNRVRGRVVGWALRVDPRHVLVAERLRAGGYDTAGFMCCEGFWGPEARTGLQRGLDHLEIERNGAKLALEAKAWLEARDRMPTRRPLFLWMHLLEPHNWTNGHSEPVDPAAKNRMYDQSLAACDRMVADVVGAFHDRPVDQRPIVIITADHGEALGDHGQPSHSTDLYNSQIHVPFVIAGPGVATARIDETVSLNDLTPSIVDLAGFAPPHGADIDGRSIADLATGRRPSDPEAGIAFAVMVRDRSNPGGVTAVVDGRWKLIDTNGKLELFDTRADSAEVHDRADDQPAILAKLTALLYDHRRSGDDSPFVE